MEHAASRRVAGGHKSVDRRAPMTETLDETPTVRAGATTRCAVDGSELEQALEEADAAAAAAAATAAQARARADRLRRQAQSATDDRADEAHQDDAGEVDTLQKDAGRDPAGADDNTVDREVPDDSSTRHRWWLKLVCATVVVALVCLAGVASGYMVWQHRTAVHQRQIAAEFVAAARQAVVTLMSMDFQRSKKDFQRLVDDSTGEFRDDFTRRADEFTTAIEQSKVVTTAKVNGAAVQSMTADSATVLVAATSEVTNAAGALREPRAWRLIVTVKRDGGLLKMSRVEFIP